MLDWKSVAPNGKIDKAKLVSVLEQFVADIESGKEVVWSVDAGYTVTSPSEWVKFVVKGSK